MKNFIVELDSVEFGVIGGYVQAESLDDACTKLGLPTEPPLEKGFPAGFVPGTNILVFLYEVTELSEVNSPDGLIALAEQAKREKAVAA